MLVAPLEPETAVLEVSIRKDYRIRAGPRDPTPEDVPLHSSSSIHRILPGFYETRLPSTSGIYTLARIP